MNELVKDPSLAAVFSPVGPPSAAQTVSLADANRPTLLNTPKTRPILLGNAPPSAAAAPPPASSNDNLTASVAANTPAGGLDNLLNAQNLNQLLGSLNTTPTHAEATKVAPPQPVCSVASVQPQSLLPTPSSTGFMQVINVTNFIMHAAWQAAGRPD